MTRVYRGLPIVSDPFSNDKGLMAFVMAITDLIAVGGREPGSSVSIVSDYGLDDRAIEVRSPAETKGFFL
jgi:hypothetical protein